MRHRATNSHRWQRADLRRRTPRARTPRCHLPSYVWPSGLVAVSAQFECRMLPRTSLRRRPSTSSGPSPVAVLARSMPGALLSEETEKPVRGLCIQGLMIGARVPDPGQRCFGAPLYCGAAWRCPDGTHRRTTLATVAFLLARAWSALSHLPAGLGRLDDISPGK
jgi:hypothetical protein